MLSLRSQQTRMLITFAIVKLSFGGTVLLQASEFWPIYAETVSESNPLTSSSTPYISSLSGDGTIIGGAVTFLGAIDCAGFECENTAFVWSIEHQQPLNLRNVDLPGTTFNTATPTRVPALSNNGKLALVTSVSGHFETTIQNGNVSQALRDPIIVGEPLFGHDMSSDGKVVVGSVGDTPFLWKDTTGLHPILGLPDESELLPVKISGNGKHVALVDRGYRPGDTLNTASNYSTADNVAIWSEAQGLQKLEPIAGNERALISSMSFEGSIVVGISSHSSSPGSSRILTATRWDNTTPTAFSSVSDFDSTIAQDVSADGSIAVGVARYEPEPGSQVSKRDLRELRAMDQAVLWEDGEAFLLRDFLASDPDLAEQIDGWRLTSATAISDDGMTITGQGIDPEGNSAAWIAVLNVPEPSSFLLLAGSFLVLMPSCNRWRQN